MVILGEQSKAKYIAYNMLNERIVSKGFCTLCGACEAACPTGALSVENEKNRRLYDCSQQMDVCPICYEVCPHSEAMVLRAMKPLSDAPAKNEAIGNYRKIVLAQSNNPKIRESSHGAGVVTSLLSYGIEQKLFDSAIVSKGEPDNPSKPKALVAIMPDDILSAVGSKFFPSPVATAYGSAVYGYCKRNIAFVGVPCHVLALRKIEASQHKIGNSLAITIGLFCFGTYSMTPLLRYLEDKYKIKSNEIKLMRLSTQFVVQTANQTIRIPMSEIEHQILPSCRTCTDFTAELADISVGSAYPLQEWSTVIIRTKAGEDFFYKAVESGIINSWVIEKEPEVYERVVRAAMQKKTSALHEAKKLEEKLGYLPILMLTESEVFAKVKAEAIMNRKVRRISGNKTINDLVDLTTQLHYIGHMVVQDDGEPVGIVTLGDASLVAREDRDKTLVKQIVRRPPISVTPNQTALEVLRLMKEHETGSILVRDPADSKKIIGMVTKSELMHTLVEQA